MTTNEAAERLRARFDPGTNVPEYIGLDISDATLLEQALAAERRATVERIDKVLAAVQERDRPPRTEWQNGYSVAIAECRAILDEEAAR